MSSFKNSILKCSYGQPCLLFRLKRETTAIKCEIAMQEHWEPKGTMSEQRK